MSRILVLIAVVAAALPSYAGISTPASGGGGFANPATADLDMGVFGITLNGGNTYLNADG
ncbi:MAG: hypothetical protein QOD99_48, partial [Chthoniobacter sp.]|nr:hypothetical protein [Chthoniobacter sp.]